MNDGRAPIRAFGDADGDLRRLAGRTIAFAGYGNQGRAQALNLRDSLRAGSIDAPPTFACQVSLDQCAGFAERAEATINAGRPICVLCGTAIESGGHKCLRRNGHSKLPVSLE